MATQVSIDLETLGTTVGSQILSIGACTFNAEGKILDKFYAVVEFQDNFEVTATVSTLKFWINQPAEAVRVIFDADKKLTQYQSLTQLSNWIKGKGEVEVWANGTKFDLGMLEEAYRSHKLVAPWKFNADRCMRTLRKFAGHIDVDYVGVSHYALDDAIWQAKYIAAACEQLGLEL
ncbi:exodeoxyribonuclease VIII [Pseudoalteromonas phage PH1]|uniref:exodeoxyribonuclease VIII n=1 Tax=Pseudoalteromonas phage PH1 TaxID=1874540 RepID=UPI00081980DC|nr:exodeoxyribonuclease VIII [Pseudoalteromonas phage PH1]ANY29526.1 exodeoxyribonuclease VIII [Pseudoalteromonas phage PH1]